MMPDKNNEFEETGLFDITDFENMKEFDDMKIIWDSQNEEKLYAINENALYKQIKRKGNSVSRLLQRFEFVMVGVNLLVAGFLVVATLFNDSDPFEYLLPFIYLAYAIIFFAWRRGRRQDDAHFEPTMLGELDKAIWQINYLIRRTRELMIWYLAPLALFVGGMMLYEGQPLFALAILIVMGGAGLLTDRWEIKRCYLPKKQSLEALRATLVGAEG